jgi:hypothetical protein
MSLNWPDQPPNARVRGTEWGGAFCLQFVPVLRDMSQDKIEQQSSRPRTQVMTWVLLEFCKNSLWFKILKILKRCTLRTK